MSGSICKSQSVRYFTNIIPDKSYNTVIVINFKKSQDRGFFTEFGQIDPYRLDDKFIIAPPPNLTDTADRLKTIIRFRIDKPSLLTIGFSEFCIAPGDSLDMNFEILKKTKDEYKDTIHIQSGNVFWTRYNGQPPYRFKAYLKRVDDSLNYLKTPRDFNQYLSQQHVNNIADRYCGLIYSEFPNLKKDNVTLAHIKGYCTNSIYQNLFSGLAGVYKKPGSDKETRDCIEANMTDMIASFYKQKELFDLPAFWVAWGGAYYFYKETKYDFASIVGKFQACNDTIKQFIMLRCLKDGIAFKIGDKKDINQLAGRFTYPPFKKISFKYLTDPNLGSDISRNLNSDVRNAEIYDINGIAFHFFDIFKNTEQPYLLFDFCGTWCVPCVEEIALYSRTPHLDHSAKVKPVWLFFENDMTKWGALIEKYHLKKENCFVVLDREFMNAFAKSFNWAQEFPHHFLFTKNGKIIDDKAASHNEFNENALTER